MNVLLYIDEEGNVSMADNALLTVKEFSELKKKGNDFFNIGISYIFLALDWRSPFFDYIAQERHIQAMASSGLTEEQFNDITFREACRKYEEIQNQTLQFRMLVAARKSVEQIIIHFNNLDLSKRNEETGMPIYKVKDVQEEIKRLSEVIDGLDKLEYQFKKQVEAPKANRAGLVDGFDPTSMDKDFYDTSTE